MQLVQRSDWGAKNPIHPPKLETVVEEVWLHHTVGYGKGGASYMRTMQTQHQFKGWSDIAYNWVIDPVTDIVYVGRGPMARPGAQKGHNNQTMAVCFMGDFRQRTLTQRNIDTLVVLMEWTSAHGFNPPFINGGHRDAPGQSTTCPGTNIHKLIPDINREIALTQGDTNMDYRNFSNVPTIRVTDIGVRTVAPWAKDTIDWAIARGMTPTSQQYDWTTVLTDGRFLTILKRYDDSASKGVDLAQVANEVASSHGHTIASAAADEIVRRLNT